MKVTESPAGVARLVGDLPADPDQVFRYFTDADLLAQWWPEEASTDLRTGGEYELRWPSQNLRLLGEYLVIEPGSRLVFTWAFAHEALRPSTVDVQFLATDEGTHVIIEHTHGDNPDERQGYVDGWKHFIGRLRDVLTRS